MQDIAHLYKDFFLSPSYILLRSHILLEISSSRALTNTCRENVTTNGFKMIPKTLIVGFGAILVAYLFSQWNDPLGERDHERNVIMAWKRKIVLPTKSFQRLVIG